MTVHLIRAYPIEAIALTFTAGIACGLAISSAVSQTSALYFPAGIALIVTFIIAAWTMRSSDSLSLLLLFISTGVFCSISYSLASAGFQSAAPCRSVEALSSMIMGMPFKDSNAAALVNALVTGDRSWLSADTAAAFRTSGASHILALSGLHLGIIYLILGYATSILGNSPAARTLRSIIIILLSGAYTIITGASPSLVRAFLFILLSESARMLHRRSRPVNTFCAALMIQLALSPSVLTSIGFQLSYLAMTGILFLYPRLKSWFPETDKRTEIMLRKHISRLPEKLWDAAALAISCQLFTGPLAWLRFGTFPKYFLITNILAMPLTGILMTLAVPAIVLHAAGLCPAFLITLTSHAASALIFIMNVISGL